MSDKNYEIPGFYRDPKTGKYFRDNPSVIKNQSLEKIKKENENQRKTTEVSTNYSKYSNIFKFLHSREIGCMSGINSEREYCKMITSNKQLFNEYSLNIYAPGNIVRVNYIKETRSLGIIGIWTASEMSKFESSVITSQTLSVNESFFYHKVYSHYITDLCEGPQHTVIYTYNNPASEKGGIVRLQLQVPELSNASPYHSKMLANCPLYCCSSTADRQYSAFGAHKFILYLNFMTEENYEIPVFNAATAHTISFNNSSDLMVIGLHTGHVSLRDIRLKENVTNIKISKYCINESYFLEPDQVIVAGLENVLCRVDMRMNKVVTEYFDHKTSLKKSALSIANNMLCASGVDNVIRLWELSGGSPIHKMHPHGSPDNTIRGWLYKEADKTYLHHFEEGFRKTFSIA